MVRKALQRRKRVQRRTPGGRIRVEYRRKMYSKHECGMCGTTLHGRPRGSPSYISKLNKTQRTPTRPFGGALCSPCTSKIISLRAKLKYGDISSDDVPISLRGYVNG